jgi:hypothetical protein
MPPRLRAKGCAARAKRGMTRAEDLAVRAMRKISRAVGRTLGAMRGTSRAKVCALRATLHKTRAQPVQRSRSSPRRVLNVPRRVPSARGPVPCPPPPVRNSPRALHCRPGACRRVATAHGAELKARYRRAAPGDSRGVVLHCPRLVRDRRSTACAGAGGIPGRRGAGSEPTRDP